ncbi:MAG: DUF3737 family protein [Lachnospiraceae bacterium]|nr:DUF3737 family protein [Lachnospiraceae bacterium]
MTKEYFEQSFDEERALYNSNDVKVVRCRFEGPADGESALKESKNIEALQSFFDLRYPFWHDENVKITDCELTSSCRAALWYSQNIEIINTKLHGIKALRECENIKISDCDIVSPEFGWFVHNISMEKSSAESEYFMMRSDRLKFNDVKLKGKYSFQYIEDSIFENCNFDTKDAFWHAKNVIVKNSVIKGEYLAWYCENLTFENCIITGTQPLCYCNGVKLINCEMHDCDLSFEKSKVDAVILNKIAGIKNPASGIIKVPGVEELIKDDPKSLCEIVIG